MSEAYKTLDLAGERFTVTQDFAAVLVEALYIAEQLNSLEGEARDKPESRRLLAIERIVSDWLPDGHALFRDYLVSVKGDRELAQNQLTVLQRDSFKCVLCGHSRSNQAGGLHVHHCVTRGQAHHWLEFLRGIGGLHSARNLAVVCSDCHKAIHEATHPEWHWRRKAYDIWQAIGLLETAHAWREAGGLARSEREEP